MKSLKTLIAGTVLAAAISLMPNAGAVAITDASFLGEIRNGTPPARADDLINLLAGVNAGQSLVIASPQPIGSQTYDRSGSTLVGPFAAATDVGFSGEIAPVASVDASGYQYIWAKYGGYAWVWYSVNGFSTSEAIPQSALSHIRLFNPITRNVPDAGTSVLLLGAGLLGIGALRRRLAK